VTGVPYVVVPLVALVCTVVVVGFDPTAAAGIAVANVPRMAAATAPVAMIRTFRP